MDVLLKLANGLRAEGVRNRLPLACMLGTITGVEETPADGHKSIIEVSSDG
jgi:hypothetical protein